MNIQDKYEGTIKPQIEALAQEIDKATKGTDLFKEFGWRVFFSPVFYKPKVMLIGINPGAGQGDNRDFDFWDGSVMFEYTNPEYSFALARETNEAFAQAGLTEVLKSSTVKTNYFFLSTTNEKDLYKITSHLGRSSDNAKELLGDKVFRKSAEWTKELIELLQPEVIVCEGKGAYDNVTELFPDYGEYAWDDDCGYTIIPGKNLTIIGYSRMISRIIDKPALAKLLKRFVKP